MKLLRTSAHLQLFGEKKTGRLMLVNSKETDFAFKRVMFDRREAETIKNLLALEIDETEKEVKKPWLFMPAPKLTKWLSSDYKPLQPPTKSNYNRAAKRNFSTSHRRDDPATPR